MLEHTQARIAALLADHPVLDGHNDLPWEARERVGYDWERLDLAGQSRVPPAPDHGRQFGGHLAAAYLRRQPCRHHLQPTANLHQLKTVSPRPG